MKIKIYPNEKVIVEHGTHQWTGTYKETRRQQDMLCMYEIRLDGEGRLSDEVLANMGMTLPQPSDHAG